MSYKVAEFIGIMLGDGSIGHYACKAGDKIKSQHVVKVTLDSRNKEYAGYVGEIMKEVLGKYPVFYYKSNENTVDLRIFGEKFLNFVIWDIGLKLSPKWDRMLIPEKYFKREFYPFILRGLFDTDGCLSVFRNGNHLYPRIEIKVCPSPAQDQILTILDELGFNYKVQKLDKEKIRIRISGKKELEKWFNSVGSSNKIHLEKQKYFKRKFYK